MRADSEMQGGDYLNKGKLATTTIGPSSCSSHRWFSFATTIVIALSTIDVVASSSSSKPPIRRVYDEIIFTSEACEQLGYKNTFEVCAILEVCESLSTDEEDGYNDRHNRKLTKDNEHDDEEWWDEEMKEEEKQQQKEKEKPEDGRPEAQWSDGGFQANVQVAKAEDVYEVEEVEEEEEEAPMSAATRDKLKFTHTKKHHQDVIDDPSDEVEIVEKIPEDEETNEDMDNGHHGSTGMNSSASYSTSTKKDPQPTMSSVASSLDSSASASSSAKPIIAKSNVNKAPFGYRLPGSKTCSYPGPIIRLQNDGTKRHGLFVRNTSTQPTNIHFHGLHMPTTGNGDNMLREIPPAADDESLTIYELDLKNMPHMGGTHWYHSHYSSARHMLIRAKDQVRSGAFGMLVVEEPFSTTQGVGTSDSNVLDFLRKERVLIVSYSPGGVWIGNGVERSIGGDSLDMVADEWYRLRILAVNANSSPKGIKVQFGDSSSPNCEVRPIAHDGILRFNVPGDIQYEYPMTLSSRLDVAIRCQADETVRVNNNYNVATIHAEPSTSRGSSLEPSTATPFENGSDSWKSFRFPYVQDLNSKSVVPVQGNYEIEVSETTINEISWDENKPLCADFDPMDFESDGGSEDFAYGKVHEWTITGASHPFHVHVYPMQVITDGCGEYHVKGEYYDTVIPSGAGKCIVRLNFIDVSGPILYHCHIFAHGGAMGWFFSSTDHTDADSMTFPPIMARDGPFCTATNSADCTVPTHTLKSCVDSSPWDDEDMYDYDDEDMNDRRALLRVRSL